MNIEAIEVISDAVFALLALGGIFYGLSVTRWMRSKVHLVKTSPSANGRLVIAKGMAASSLRQTLVCVMAFFIGSIVLIRDALEITEPGVPSSLFSLLLRVLFILVILGIFDALRIKKRTYIDYERPR